MKNIDITSKVLNNIHLENDCFGKMVFTRKDTECTFNDRPFCNYDDKETTYSIYNYSKCYGRSKRTIPRRSKGLNSIFSLQIKQQMISALSSIKQSKQ